METQLHSLCLLLPSKTFLFLMQILTIQLIVSQKIEEYRMFYNQLRSCLAFTEISAKQIYGRYDFRRLNFNVSFDTTL